LQEWLEKIKNTKDLNELEKIRIELFGKKGYITNEFAKIKTLPNEQKKEFAKNLNELKQTLTNELENKKKILQELELEKKLKSEKIDVTKFNNFKTTGAPHPVVETMNKIISYFQNLNFSVEEGPLVESDFNNFEALNIPKYHPARDMQDTFYTKDGFVLRTHTSPVQIRTMLSQKPPIRMIAPGAVFRKDFDLTHTPMFHQIEGLVVDEEDKISFANLF